LYSVLGIWGTAGLAIYLANSKFEIRDSRFPAALAAVAVVFFVSQLTRAILRQKMAHRLLHDEHRAMRAACAADVVAFWLWSLLLLLLIVSSAFGRTICWRGIRYKLLSPTEIIIVGKKESPEPARTLESFMERK
jgi:hypothetical protein